MEDPVTLAAACRHRLRNVVAVSSWGCPAMAPPEIQSTAVLVRSNGEPLCWLPDATKYVVTTGGIPTPDLLNQFFAWSRDFQVITRVGSRSQLDQVAKVSEQYAELQDPNVSYTYRAAQKLLTTQVPTANDELWAIESSDPARAFLVEKWEQGATTAITAGSWGWLTLHHTDGLVLRPANSSASFAFSTCTIHNGSAVFEAESEELYRCPAPIQLVQLAAGGSIRATRRTRMEATQFSRMNLAAAVGSSQRQSLHVITTPTFQP